MSAACELRWALDPAQLFADATGLKAAPWQGAVLRSGAPQVSLCCSRQAGKSTLTAVKALHVAMFHAGALVLLVAPTQKQAGELHHKARTFYKALGKPRGSEGDSATALIFGNDSRILALSGNADSVRGYSRPRLLVADEAARVSGDLYFAIRPMMAASPPGSQLFALSTPAGRRGWFWEDVWADEADPAWDRYRVPADRLPWIDAHFLARERASMTREVFEQEFMTAFHSSPAGVFDAASVRSAVTPEVPSWRF